MLGTNCPIPAGWNWTYEFQVKDQIGSFFYFPSTNFQRAAGGYGGITINNRDVIAVPFGAPDGDITLVIGDWFIKSHKVSIFSIFIRSNSPKKLHSRAFFYVGIDNLFRAIFDDDYEEDIYVFCVQTRDRE